jgi:hypothetical protein
MFHWNSEVVSAITVAKTLYADAPGYLLAPQSLAIAMGALVERS